MKKQEQEQELRQGTGVGQEANVTDGADGKHAEPAKVCDEHNSVNDIERVAEHRNTRMDMRCKRASKTTA